jgi:hypothetical protein
MATEAMKLNSSPSSLLVDDYHTGVYPLNIEVKLVDFYNEVIYDKSMDNQLMEAIAYPNQYSCLSNYQNSKLLGNTIARVIDGFAKFQHMAGVCFPGGTSPYAYYVCFSLIK